MSPRRAFALPAGLLLLCASAALGETNYGAGLAGVEAELGSEQLDLERARARKQELEAQLAAAGPAREQIEQRVRQNARTLYRISRGGMMPIAGGMDALLGHASRLRRMQRLVQKDVQAAAELRGQTRDLSAQLVRAEGAIASAQEKLAGLQAARSDALRERTVQRAYEGALAPAAAQRLPSHAHYGLSVVSGAAPAERFADQRGNLALPVSGPSSIQDASRAESDGPGLEFSGAPGAAVRAAASGRVAFAESYGSYGKLVILDHGDRYYTAYGGLARLEVQVGDDVSKSARLGSAGTDAVYFEVRRGTKTQDARAWVGL